MLYFGFFSSFWNAIPNKCENQQCIVLSIDSFYFEWKLCTWWGVFNLNKCIFIDDIAMRFWTESWIVYPCIRFKYFSLHYTDNMEFLTDFSIVSRHLMTTSNYRINSHGFIFNRRKKRSNEKKNIPTRDYNFI